MRLTRLKARAVVLLASCAMANLTALATERPQADRDEVRPAAATNDDPGSPQDPAAANTKDPPATAGDGGVQGKRRILTPDGKRLYVSVYSTDPGHNQAFLCNYAFVNFVPEIKRVRGVDTATVLDGDRRSAIRIRLNSDHMRAHNLTSEDVMQALTPSSILGAFGKIWQSEENVLIQTGHYGKDYNRCENIILRANSDGDILRLKDVGRVELISTLFGIRSEVDGYPSATIVLRQIPGSDAAEAIEAIEEKLKQIEKESFPRGMKYDVIPFEARDIIYAVLEAPRDSTLEYTRAKCHELGAIAKGIDEISSVWSLAGYEIRTESRDSNAGTCLIHLKDDRQLNSRQIIEALKEKCRTMNDPIEFFEPPAVSVFVAAGGFSVRVLEKTNSNDKRLARAPEASMDDLLNRKDLESLFTFLAGNYPQHELIINLDMATQKGVSIASAVESLAPVVGVDFQDERHLRGLAEDLSNLFVRNNRGEMIPATSFMRLKEKPALNRIGR